MNILVVEGWGVWCAKKGVLNYMVSKVIHSSKSFKNQSYPTSDMEANCSGNTQDFVYCGVDWERPFTGETMPVLFTEGKHISVHNPLCYPQPRVSSHWSDTKRVHLCKYTNVQPWFWGTVNHKGYQSILSTRYSLVLGRERYVHPIYILLF